MKKRISLWTLLGGFAILVAGAVVLSSCEGPQGPPGLDGTDGVDGVDGIDASTTCIECHNDDQTIVTATKQYNNSGHALGHTAGYTNRSFGELYNCAGCHTSQGFLDAIMGESNLPYANVTQPNCYTCHNIHDTYTEEDWALTHPDVTLPASGSDGVDMGSGNQCTFCHQAVGQYLVNSSNLFENFDDGGATNVEITAGELRVGVHHAPQYNILAGMDLFEFSGSATIPTENHVLMQAPDGCVTCHMNDGFGDLTGHSMAMKYEFHGSENLHWSATCTACHEEDGNLDLTDKYEEIAAATDAQLSTLYDLLVAAGIMYPADGSNAYLMQPGNFTTELVAAHVNYNAIREDRSGGFHNPEYASAVLTNTIEALQAK